MANTKERRVEEVEQEVVTPAGGAVAIDATKAKLVGKRRLFTLPQWAVAWIVLIPALIFIILFILLLALVPYVFLRISSKKIDSQIRALLEKCDIEYMEEPERLKCINCQKEYQIINGIPIMGGIDDRFDDFESE